MKVYLVNVVSKAIRQRGRLQEETVVLVGRFGETHAVRVLRHGLSVRHDGIRLLDWNAGVILLQILEANLQVQFSGTSDDVFTGLFDDALKVHNSLRHRMFLEEKTSSKFMWSMHQTQVSFMGKSGLRPKLIIICIENHLHFKH